MQISTPMLIRSTPGSYFPDPMATACQYNGPGTLAAVIVHAPVNVDAQVIAHPSGVVNSYSRLPVVDAHGVAVVNSYTGVVNSYTGHPADHPTVVNTHSVGYNNVPLAASVAYPGGPVAFSGGAVAYPGGPVAYPGPYQSVPVPYPAASMATTGAPLAGAPVIDPVAFQAAVAAQLGEQCVEGHVEVDGAAGEVIVEQEVVVPHAEQAEAGAPADDAAGSGMQAGEGDAMILSSKGMATIL